MLSIYTRHLASCPATGIHHRRCRCPKWVQGKIAGRPFLRKSTGATSWEQAERIARQMEERALGVEGRITLEHALAAFVAQKEGQQFSSAWMYKVRRLQHTFLNDARQRSGLLYLDEYDAHQLVAWRATWGVSPITAAKYQDLLRSFFTYCVESDWIKKNPVKLMGRIRVRPHATDYFTSDEYSRLLEEVNHPKHWITCPAQRARMLAMIELLRYSGLRITDAVTLDRNRLVDGKLFLYQHKNGRPVFVPLPPHVVELLKSLTNDNPRYFFWSGNGVATRAMNPWEYSFKLLFGWADLGKRCHIHMFRDTFAVELLLAGVPLDQVSILLGHRSIKVTEKHYAPFVKARQEQITINVMKGWPEARLALVKKQKA